MHCQAFKDILVVYCCYFEVGFLVAYIVVVAIKLSKRFNVHSLTTFVINKGNFFTYQHQKHASNDLTLPEYKAAWLLDT